MVYTIKDLKIDYLKYSARLDMLILKLYELLFSHYVISKILLSLFLLINYLIILLKRTLVSDKKPKL